MMHIMDGEEAERSAWQHGETISHSHVMRLQCLPRIDKPSYKFRD